MKPLVLAAIATLSATVCGCAPAAPALVCAGSSVEYSKVRKLEFYVASDVYYVTAVAIQPCPQVTMDMDISPLSPAERQEVWGTLNGWRDSQGKSYVTGLMAATVRILPGGNGGLPKVQVQHVDHFEPAIPPVAYRGALLLDGAVHPVSAPR